MRAAQRDLASEIEPQIKELIERAEGGLEGLKKRERALQAKVRFVWCGPAATTS